MTATVSHEPAPRLGPHERLERLCDPGTLQVIRTEVTSARMGEQGAPGRRRRRRRRPRRRPPGVRLRAGRQLRRRLAGRAARRHDRAHPRAGRARPRPGRRLHRVRRRTPAGGRVGAGRLRPDLPRQRGAVGARAADLGHHRHVGRRRLLLAGPDRLRDHDPGGGDVPHRPRRRARGHGRGRRRGRARRHRACTSATASATASPRTAPAPSRWRATCSPTCPRARGASAEPGVPEPPATERPERGRARRPAARLRRARRSCDALVDGGALRRDRAALGAQHRLRVRAHRGPPGRRRRQPAAHASAACSTPTRPRRPPASCARATRSGCR